MNALKTKKVFFQICFISFAVILFIAATILFFVSRPKKSIEFYSEAVNIKRLDPLEVALADSLKIEKDNIFLLDFNTLRVDNTGKIQEINFNILIHKNNKFNLFQIENVNEKYSYRHIGSAEPSDYFIKFTIYCEIFSRLPISHILEKIQYTTALDLRIANRLVNESNRTNYYVVDINRDIEENKQLDYNKKYIQIAVTPQKNGDWESHKNIAYYILLK